MLSQSLRRALLKPPTSPSFRALSTTALPSSSHPSDAPPIFKQRRRNVKVSAVDEARLETLQRTVVPKYDIKPVFVELSSLIDEPGPSSAGGQVAVLAPSVFRHPIRRDILHLCVVHHLDGLRQGTAATKSRGEVRGSGIKIRRQKGSGMARLGDGQSPMLRGGGHTFAKKARDFSTKLPRKVIQMGMRVALSVKVKEDGFGVVESLEWPGFKTKDLAKRLNELGWNRTLFVTGMEKVPETLRRSSSNIQGVDVVTASQLTVYDAVKWERLVLDIPAVEFYEKTLGKAQIDETIVLE